MWRGLLLFLVGCASSKATVVLHAPPNAVISTIRFTDAEVAANAHRDLTKLYDWFERLERAHDEDTDPTTVTLQVDAPSWLRLVVDTTGAGLDAMLEDGTLLRVPRGARVVETLPGPAARSTKEPCAGARFEKLTLDGHVLCAYLPTSYATEPTRRFPVVFVLPGFGGHAFFNDGFSARGLFDAYLDTPVILIGVETRTPEGTGYMTGAWEQYFVTRVVPEVEARFRTNGRRAAFGHSTGGWNTLSLALRHPELFSAVGASSPDPLDFDVWLFDASGSTRARWFYWQRAEQRLGGRGQFTSWALSWSNNTPLFDDDAVINRDVLAAWKRASPLSLLNKQKVPMFITAGRADMFDLFTPTERFVEAARAKRLDVTWAPTGLDHFGETEARFTPLVKFLLERL